MPVDEQERNERAQARLEAFVLRARRVGGHSLAADREQLLTWAQRKLTLQFREDGTPVGLAIDLPDEELFESLAARCRPFLLARDPVHYASVLGALRNFTGRGTELGDWVDKLSKEWRRFAPGSNDEILAYAVQQADSTGTFGDSVPDRALAHAWLYGDLVHADPNASAAAREHDLDSRFEAGVLVVANIAVLVIKTLNLILMARTKGVVSLDDSVLTQPVKAKGSRTMELVSFAAAPLGTPPDEITASLDAAVAKERDGQQDV